MNSNIDLKSCSVFDFINIKIVAWNWIEYSNKLQFLNIMQYMFPSNFSWKPLWMHTKCQAIWMIGNGFWQYSLKNQKNSFFFRNTLKRRNCIAYSDIAHIIGSLGQIESAFCNFRHRDRESVIKNWPSSVHILFIRLHSCRHSCIWMCREWENLFRFWVLLQNMTYCVWHFTCDTTCIYDIVFRYWLCEFCMALVFKIEWNFSSSTRSMCIVLILIFLPIAAYIDFWIIDENFNRKLQKFQELMSFYMHLLHFNIACFSHNQVIFNEFHFVALFIEKNIYI